MSARRSLVEVDALEGHLDPTVLRAGLLVVGAALLGHGLDRAHTLGGDPVSRDPGGNEGLGDGRCPVLAQPALRSSAPSVGVSDDRDRDDVGELAS